MTGGAAFGYDPIRELRDLLARHPHVTYLPARESDSGKHEARWTQPSAGEHEGAVVIVRHADVRDLLAELWALLGPGAPE